RTENTESSHVEQQIHLQAIGHPEIGFVFVNDERVVHQLPATANLRDRIRGFIGKPGVSRSTRAQQIVFINGRAVENSTINYALREGFHTALMKGQYPVTFLFIDMDPAAVDVNVHPAKREVRFREPSLVRDAVIETVRRTIETGRGEWTKTFDTGNRVETARVSFPAIHNHQPAIDTPPLIAPREQIALRQDWPALPSQPQPAKVRTEPEQIGNQQSEPGNFKILGVLGRLYVLMENESGLVLVDQHAAHERILFEELRRRMEEQGVSAQRLLMPLTIQLNPRDGDWIAQNLSTLQKMGIGIEPFGAG